nr:hypothetical protein [Tanacetum cinerariifolium]GEY33732.1 hypothetical protein [Tanacetum cinerariifolium]
MDSVNMFDPMTLSDAYQRALAFEKHNRRVGSSSSPAITGGVFGLSNVASHFVSNQARLGGGNGLKCFNCGEPGHRQSECKKAEKRTLLLSLRNGKMMAWLMTIMKKPRRSCLTPQAVGVDWLKHNIFQSTCTILGKVCIFMVDPRSCDNLIAEEAAQKLGLKAKNRPKPYKLQWLKKGSEVTVYRRVLVTFYVGTTYKDSVWCDMVPMDTYHLLLGRPWEYDRNTTHNGRANTYSFLFGVTHWFTLIALSALRRSDNENTLSLMNLILRSILTDLQVTPTKPGRMKKPYSSHRFIANCFNARNFKMDVKVPGSSGLIIHNHMLIPNYQV